MQAKRHYQVKLNGLAKALHIWIDVIELRSAVDQCDSNSTEDFILRKLRHECTNYDNARKSLEERYTVEYVESIKDFVNDRCQDERQQTAKSRPGDEWQVEGWGKWRLLAAHPTTEQR